MRYIWTVRLGDEPDATSKWRIVAEDSQGAISEAQRLHRQIYGENAQATVWGLRCGRYVEGVAEEGK